MVVVVVGAGGAVAAVVVVVVVLPVSRFSACQQNYYQNAYHHHRQQTDAVTSNNKKDKQARDGGILTSAARSKLGPKLIFRSGLWFGARVVVPRCFVIAQQRSPCLLVLCQRGPVLKGRRRLLFLTRQVVPCDLVIPQHCCARLFAITSW